MRFQGGPVDGREFAYRWPTRTVKVPVLKAMSDEHWRPSRHSRRPHAEHRLRSDFFDCDNRQCRELSHYLWTAVYRFTPPESLAFVSEEEPWR